jgi:putative NADH-flavin reductase
MRVLVLGATGSVGRLVVEEALIRSHHVTALVRHPERFDVLATRVTTVVGDALDSAAVSRPVRLRRNDALNVPGNETRNPHDSRGITIALRNVPQPHGKVLRHLRQCA